MTTPRHASDLVTLYLGDCLEVLATMGQASVDAIVTDPPYDLVCGRPGGFMDKKWDMTGVAFDPATWESVLRVLKPGGHLLACGAPRTWHRMVCAIEDAGFEIRDGVASLTGQDAPGLMWCYGSGFPKSIDVSKSIDKAAGAERDRVPHRGGIAYGPGNYGGGGKTHVGTRQVDEPVTEDAARWHGWGTALKPAWEPIAVARKPLTGTLAANVLQSGTGGINVSGCRVSGGSEPDRLPPNLLLGHSAECNGTCIPGCPVAEVDEQGGGASRFFPCFRYEAKAPARERPRLADGTAWPTVKPLSLMRWLVRLVTPPGGVVLDPFAGTGTTGEACTLEGFRCILIERDPVAAELATRRLSKPIAPALFT